MLAAELPQLLCGNGGAARGRANRDANAPGSGLVRGRGAPDREGERKKRTQKRVKVMLIKSNVVGLISWWLCWL